jgi:hypothetical protein
MSIAAFKFTTVDVPVLDAQGNKTGATVTLANTYYGSGLFHCLFGV